MHDPELDVEIENDSPNFVMVPNELIDADVSPRAIAAYVHLRRRASWGSGRVDYSLALLAKQLGYAKRDSAKPYLDELIALGFVEVHERHGANGARIRNRYVVRLTPTRSQGEGPTPPTGGPLPLPAGNPSPSQRVASTEPLLSEPLSQKAPLAGLESDPEPKVIPSRKPVRPDVERLALEGTRVFAISDEKARVDANARRIAELILDERKTSPEEIVAILRWATSDAFWGPKVLTWSKFREHFVQLRKQASVTGPARAGASADAAAAGRPDPLRIGADPLEADDRRRAGWMLTRGIDPAEWWRAGVDPVAAISRVRSLPRTWAGDVEELVVSWENRDSQPWPALGWTASEHL